MNPRGLSALRALSRPMLPIQGSSRAMSTKYYAPTQSQLAEMDRPPRPASEHFFTTKPIYSEALSSLRKLLDDSERTLRDEYIWPLPAHVPRPPPPPGAWKTAERLALPIARNSDYDKLVDVLNNLNRMRQVAYMAGSRVVSDNIDKAIAPFQRADLIALAEARRAKKAAERKTSGVDEFGRAYGTGRRKACSARVWVVPSEAGRAISAAEETEVAPPVPSSEVLINHLPLPLHFPRPVDRDAVLRPFRVTGLLGAYNVFALVRGGGTTGQSGAVSLAIARALKKLQPDTYDVLRNDGALWRDIRVVERKKTGLAKSRKRYTWVKR